LLLYGLPTLVLLGLVAWPLATGRSTLILRDVLQVHLAFKAPQAAAFRHGYLPAIDPYRGGGQPVTGNPNTLPFYPDNLLYLVASPMWALNAHFWLHLLLAPLAGYALGRAWGLPPPAAWAAGACYATSGFFLSHLSFYNLIAGAVWTPLLVAAALSVRAGRRWAPPAAGALWALVLVSGDPITGALAAILTAGAFLAAPRVPGRSAKRATAALAAAIAVGSLVALPQIVELLRVLPATYRGYWGFADGHLALGSFQPVHALEWLVPTAFGRFDLGGAGGFWAFPLFGDDQPFFLSLYPGLLALALVAAAGRPRRRAAWWAWGSVALGGFLALGGYNPLARWLFELPGGSSFRFPIKAWLLVATGAALLSGLGFERAFGRSGRLRRLGWPLAALAAALGGVWLVLVAAPGRFEHWVVAHARAGWTVEMAAVERARWVALLVVSLALLAAFGACLALARRRPALAAALLLAVHGAGQLHLLRGLRVTDEAAFYRAPPPLLAAVPPGATVVDAGYAHLFGPPPPDARRGARPAAPIRQDYLGLAPFSGVLHGRRYELDRSPEGLYSFLSRVAADAVRASPSDADRVRALAHWGVDVVVAAKPLDDVPQSVAIPVARWQGLVAPVYLYRLVDAAPEVRLAESPVRVPHLNAAWQLFRSPGFDPERHAVLPGPEDAPVPRLPEAGPGPPGRVRIVRDGPESLEVAVESAAGGELVVQRALLPIWRGSVDGAPAELEPADLYRIGVAVPAGRHRVRLWVDRGPLRLASGAAGLGLLGLAGWAAWAGLGFARRGRSGSVGAGEAVEVEGAAEDV
jgi:hypothetical protein